MSILQVGHIMKSITSTKFMDIVQGNARSLLAFGKKKTKMWNRYCYLATIFWVRVTSYSVSFVRILYIYTLHIVIIIQKSCR